MEIFNADLSLIVPELVLSGAILLGTLLLIVFKKAEVTYYFSLAVLVGLLIFNFLNNNAGVAFFELIRSLKSFNLIKSLIIACGIIVLLMSPSYLKSRSKFYSEFSLFVLAIVLGASIALNSDSLLYLFIGIEMVSLFSYVLIAIDRDNRKAVESAFKYFIIGSASSGFMLFGSALLFGATGSLIYGFSSQPLAGLNFYEQVLYLVGGGMFLIGLLSKMGVAPTHFWVADVYEGAPTPVTAILLVIPKILLFTILFKFLQSPLIMPHNNSWHSIIVLFGNISIFLGAIMAVTTKNLKRILAYSSISHSGYLILLLAFHDRFIFLPYIYYFIAYALANFGFITCLLIIFKDKETIFIDDLKGLAKSHPYLATASGFFMLSLAGIPFTPGFLAKVLLILQVSNGGMLQLVAVVISSVISAVFYLNIIAQFFKSGAVESSQPKPILLICAISIILLLSLVVILYPNFYKFIFI